MPTRAPAAHRLRAQDIIERQAETIRNLTERHTAGPPQVAVELTRNAKGDTQISVKVTANLDADARELKAHTTAVLKVAADAYDVAAKRYKIAPPAALVTTPAGSPVTARGRAVTVAKARARKAT